MQSAGQGHLELREDRQHFHVRTLLDQVASEHNQIARRRDTQCVGHQPLEIDHIGVVLDVGQDGHNDAVDEARGGRHLRQLWVGDDVLDSRQLHRGGAMHTELGSSVGTNTASDDRQGHITGHIQLTFNQQVVEHGQSAGSTESQLFSGRRIEGQELRRVGHQERDQAVIVVTRDGNIVQPLVQGRFHIQRHHAGLQGSTHGIGSCTVRYTIASHDDEDVGVQAVIADHAIQQQLVQGSLHFTGSVGQLIEEQEPTGKTIRHFHAF